MTFLFSSLFQLLVLSLTAAAALAQTDFDYYDNDDGGFVLDSRSGSSSRRGGGGSQRSLVGRGRAVPPLADIARAIGGGGPADEEETATPVPILKQINE